MYYKEKWGVPTFRRTTINLDYEPVHILTPNVFYRKYP
jgi:hypothetical protein